MGPLTKAGAGAVSGGGEQKPTVASLTQELNATNASIAKMKIPSIRVQLEARARGLQKQIDELKNPAPQPPQVDERTQITQELAKTRQQIKEIFVPSIKIQLRARERELEAKLNALDNPPPAPKVPTTEERKAELSKRIAELDKTISSWYTPAIVKMAARTEREEKQKELAGL